MARTALVVGASGIVEYNLFTYLVTEGEAWSVYSLARRSTAIESVHAVATDLLQPESLKTALHGIKPTHIYLCTWMRQATEADNIRVNGSMVRNLLDVVSPIGTVEHVALVTGLKHYLGPFETWGKEGSSHPTPFREEQGHLDVEKFYYTQEDEIFAAAARDGFEWSVHRANTIIGYAVGNAMNMVVTLAVYATICRETGRPFLFPDSAVQWNGLGDVTDARQLARHLTWVSTTPTARNEAFNVVNGDVFRWSWMWKQLAEWFGVEPAPFPERSTPLERQIADAAPIWEKIARRHGLAESNVNALISPWHTDLDLGRTIEVVVDMGKSRKLGFLDYQTTFDGFSDLFTRLREAQLIL